MVEFLGEIKNILNWLMAWIVELGPELKSVLDDLGIEIG